MAEVGGRPGDKPVQNKWYWNKRIEAIEAGLVTTEHNWDVVRTWLATVAKKQEVAGQDPANDID